MMDEQLMAVITDAIFAILVALIGWATKAIVAYFNEKGLVEKLNKKAYLVDIAVRATEQIWQNEEGHVKLEKAKSEAVKLLNEHGLSITEVELQNFIEASVEEINMVLKKEKTTLIVEGEELYE